MNSHEELSSVSGEIRRMNGTIESLQRELRPYWQERGDLEERIKLTHKYIVTPVYRDGELVHDRIDVIGFDFSGASLRAPLFPRLDALRIEYAPAHVALREAQRRIKELAKLADHMRKAIEKEQRKKPADQDHRCAQCNGAIDGTEREYDGVWLHPECVRFYKGN